MNLTPDIPDRRPSLALSSANMLLEDFDTGNALVLYGIAQQAGCPPIDGRLSDTDDASSVGTRGRSLALTLTHTLSF
jgi:hypothetical protein